ncbi:MAG: glycosyltransferase [Patescibacteria group bacterium]|nr:glycosyltransferase [Patescibacteria group bacterium]
MKEDKTKLKEYFNKIVPRHHYWRNKNRYYYSYIENHISFIVPQGKKVLEIGCGTGEFLVGLKPSKGLGIDISERMIEMARAKNADENIEFKVGEIDDVEEVFDYIIISDLIGYLPDIEEFFRKLEKITHSSSRIVITQYSKLWEPILDFGSKIGLRMPSVNQNWVSQTDIKNFLHLSDLEAVKSSSKLLFPKYIPIISRILNEFLVNMPFFNKLGLVNFVVARPSNKRNDGNPSISIIVPARNEAGTIKKIVDELPDLGKFTEIIFIEGHSKDNTLEEIKKVVDSYKGPKILKYAVQDGKGKGDAVRKGFDMATGDILMIYDADMTVPAGEVYKFYDAIVRDKGDFVNGCRLVYPQEKESMQMINYIGNKFFGAMFSWIIEQPIKDTLCGTKVLWKKDYEDIKTNRKFFGDFDPFGDFDLLFGAAKLNLKIIDLPIRYKSRIYGSTNISRFKHGWLLIKMMFFSMKKLKFR